MPANTAGRDFVFGDLHGCLDLLEEELSRVEFDISVDRLFSVGDLIDRGPDSMGCLRLLREPWFHAVRGNHEQMLLAYFHEKTSPEASSELTKVFLRNGGRWVQELDAAVRDELREDLLPRVAALPFVISVGEGSKRFNIVHAELMSGSIDPDGWLARLAGLPQDEASQRILTDELLTDASLAEMTEPLAWGRRLVKSIDMKAADKIVTPAGPVLKSTRAMRPNLSLTYAGHTPQGCMLLHESHLFIDRGAFKRDVGTRLLVLNHQEVLAWLA
ncbi:metallophosphoesterase [Pusillimonas sp.]|uniref:metallophosphoesterase n=1 Tax=Pusillimonas sp. TaxID=3040095 RepID=UPI0037CABC90